MYYTNQIVHDITNNRPVRISANYYESPRNRRRVTTHYIKHDDTCDARRDKYEYVIAMPANVRQAKVLLEGGLISPAPWPVTHCNKCGNWKTNHNIDGSCRR